MEFRKMLMITLYAEQKKSQIFDRSKYMIPSEGREKVVMDVKNGSLKAFYFEGMTP